MTTDNKKIMLAFVVGLVVVILIGLFFSGILRVQTHQEYGYIDYDGNYGKAQECSEWYGSIKCKSNGHTFQVQEYWMLVEGQ